MEVDYSDGSLWFDDDPGPLTIRRNWKKDILDQLLARTVYCYCECMNPLGMENYDIPDDKITASSYKVAVDGPRLPEYGRLRHASTWVSDQGDHPIWIQVDLDAVLIVTGVLTQGRRASADFKHCVDEFKVKTGLAVSSLSYIQDNTGGVKTFTTHCTDNHVRIVTSVFPSRARAQFVRIEPTICYTNFLIKDNCILRFELLGCKNPGNNSTNITCF
ncbi:lactadherin-like [Amphiura filiformis]|uniref:lactadherin-like n=1 Tax=Amphiura filiformis TaxID=82378 RepID=UPI003B21616D